jgi:hypothetical protein
MDNTNTPVIRKVRAVLITSVLNGELYEEGSVEKGLAAFGLKSSDEVVAAEIKAFFAHFGPSQRACEHTMTRDAAVGDALK